LAPPVSGRQRIEARAADVFMSDLAALIIEDERNIRRALRVCLESLEAKVTEASSFAEALAAIRRDTFDLVFLDLRLGTRSGLELISPLLSGNPNAAIVVVTAFPARATEIEAIRRGAWKYLAKPFAPNQIRDLVEKVERGPRPCGASAMPTGVWDRTIQRNDPETESDAGS
jgi:NtrC-family two-component system response regulator AlgB